MFQLSSSISLCLSLSLSVFGFLCVSLPPSLLAIFALSVSSECLFLFTNSLTRISLHLIRVSPFDLCFICIALMSISSHYCSRSVSRSFSPTHFFNRHWISGDNPLHMTHCS